MIAQPSLTRVQQREATAAVAMVRAARDHFRDAELAEVDFLVADYDLGRLDADGAAALDAFAAKAEGRRDRYDARRAPAPGPADEAVPPATRRFLGGDEIYAFRRECVARAARGER